MKNLILLPFIFFTLSACKSSHGPSTTNDGGGAGNGGGHKTVTEEEDAETIANIPNVSEEEEEEQFTSSLHLRAEFDYMWKSIGENSPESIKFFKKPRLLFSKQHSQNPNYTFYLYTKPVGVGQVHFTLVRMKKAFYELNIDDILKIMRSARGTVTETTTSANLSSRFFWTHQRISLAIFSEEDQSLSTKSKESLVLEGPVANLKFKNFVKLNDTNVLIRSEIDDEDLNNIKKSMNQNGLGESPFAPDYNSLAYTVQFPFAAISEELDESGQSRFGDISGLLIEE